jgi:Tfp pilus assembly protein PilF
VTERIQLNSTPRRVVLVATFFILAAANFMIGKWGFANMVSTRADDTRIADLAVELGPDDPQTHFAAAVLYDRTFLASDQQRSLAEYETATALSPHNYLLWLEYGKALGRNGDDERAEAAFRRAQELAPDYAAVQWALGNLLVREGKQAEGAEQIKHAVEGDDTLAAPAVSFAYQFFAGDVSTIQQNLGRSRQVGAALALTLARDKRYDDAAAVWNSIANVSSDESLSEQRLTLMSNFIAAKRFRLAFGVSPESADSAAPDQITDGGFEQTIKLENAGPFEWQISPGSQPQPLQSTSQQHGGQRSLVLRFSSNDGGGLRQLSQTVIVTPAAKYLLSGFYRSDVKSDSRAVWQVVAANNSVLAEAPVAAAEANWTPFEASFAVPADTDGIQIRLIVKGCSSAICPISGSLWLDDLSITRN